MDFCSRCYPYAVLLVAPWQTRPPLQPKPLLPVGFERTGQPTKVSTQHGGPLGFTHWRMANGMGSPHRFLRNKAVH